MKQKRNSFLFCFLNIFKKLAASTTNKKKSQKKKPNSCKIKYQILLHTITRETNKNKKEKRTKKNFI